MAIGDSFSASSPSPPAAESEAAGEQVALAPLPPPRQIDAPSLAMFSVLDGVLAILTLALALLLGLTAGRSSVIWLHLATGRAIATAACRPGVDPFTIEDQLGAAHTWLSDLLAYGAYQLAGGAGVVLGKTLLGGLLAFALVLLGLRGRKWALPTFCACLSLVTLGVYLSPRPVIFSYLLLPFTLWLLEQRSLLPGARGPTSGWLRAYAPLLVCFLLWSNLDDWFLLGPLAVLLYAVGEGIAYLSGQNKGEKLPGLALLVVLGLTVCLLNPAGLHALSLPPELGLSAAASSLQQDPTLHRVFFSPFQEEYRRTDQLLNPSGISYLALVILGGLSFVASPRGRSSWRLPVWLTFFLLSAWNIQGIPFFAVVAGPVLALNVHDLLTQLRRGREQTDAEDVWARLGRSVALPALVLLVVAAWPGWLQAPPYEMRRWDLPLDPDLARTAATLHSWHQDGQLNGSQGLLLTTEAANYLAWLCPEEKGWVNSRLRASPQLTADFVAVRRTLFRPEPPDPKAPSWREVLRARGVNHVVTYNIESMRVRLRPLLLDSVEWPLLRAPGRLVLFGWQDPDRPHERLPFPREDLDRLAFAPTEADRAPAEGPGRPEPPLLEDAFLRRHPERSAACDEAAFYIMLFESRRSEVIQQHTLTWGQVLAAGSVLQAGDPSLAGLCRHLLSRHTIELLARGAYVNEKGELTPADQLGRWISAEHLFQQDDGPMAALLLAVRAARRAVRDNPRDPLAHLALGEAYLHLVRDTRERLWITMYRMVDWRRLRQVQALAALRHAIVLQPDLWQAHRGLASLYEEMNCPELLLHHLREMLRIRTDIDRRSGITSDEGMQALEKRVHQLEGEVERLRNRYELASSKLSIDKRARVAQDRGLWQTALDLLLETDAAALGVEAVGMEMELLLSVGRADDVREWLVPDWEKALEPHTPGLYRTVRLQAAVACGDYDEATEHFAQLSQQLEQPVKILGQELPRQEGLALVLAKNIADGSQRRDSLVSLFRADMNWTAALDWARQNLSDRRKKANRQVAWALVALEQGDTPRARALIEEALASAPRDADAGPNPLFRFFRRPVAEQVLRWLKGSYPQPRLLDLPGKQ